MPEPAPLKFTKSASMRGWLALLLFVPITNLIGVGQNKIPLFTARTELVQVSVIALDQEGRIATGLTKQDFEVFEDGVKQDIIECMSDTGPVSIAFVLDKSRSMLQHLPGRVQAIQFRHENVQDNQIGLQPSALLYRIPSVSGLAADFPAFMRAEQ